MKNLVPKRIPIFAVIVLLFISQKTPAQDQVQKKAIKEWLIAHKNEIVLISSEMHQNMSPKVKGLLTEDKRTIVYQQEVTLEDIKNFEQKNGLTPAVAFSVSESIISPESDQQQLKKWMEEQRAKNIKIISYQDYKSRPIVEQMYIDKLEHKIIYKGKELRWEDVEKYRQAKKN